MTHAGKRAKGRAWQTRRLAILERAALSFAEVGYDGASMDVIAHAAGVSKMTVYAHFHDKTRLFNAVLDYWLQQLPLPRVVPDPNADFRGKLTTVAMDLIRQNQHPAAIALTSTLAHAASVPGEPCAHLRKRYEPHLLQLETILTGHCALPHLAARQFVMLVTGNTSLSPDAACGLPPADVEENAMAAVDIFDSAYARKHARTRRRSAAQTDPGNDADQRGNPR
jgi:AcrR family transcriptional regulator